MQIGLIGLGRMGFNMARRWLGGKHTVVAYNRSAQKADAIAAQGAVAALTLASLVERLAAPRILWLMLPAGQIVDDHLDQLVGLLAPGDLVVDGANGHFRDAQRRAEKLRAHRIGFIDAGVSGGIWGLKNGYCTMVGGDAADVRRIEPLLNTLAPEDGFLHAGPVGAGHFLKMTHNGIEYGLMQAYAEGFELLNASEFHYDLKAVAALWNRGSVVRSWLLELMERALDADPQLATLKARVDDSGEGRWTVQQAIELGVPAPAITAAVFQRFASRQEDGFGLRVLAALRREFGGHAVTPADRGSSATVTDQSA